MSYFPTNVSLQQRPSSRVPSLGALQDCQGPPGDRKLAMTVLPELPPAAPKGLHHPGSGNEGWE